MLMTVATYIIYTRVCLQYRQQAKEIVDYQEYSDRISDKIAIQEMRDDSEISEEEYIEMMRQLGYAVIHVYM